MVINPLAYIVLLLAVCGSVRSQCTWGGQAQCFTVIADSLLGGSPGNAECFETCIGIKLGRDNVPNYCRRSKPCEYTHQSDCASKCSVCSRLKRDVEKGAIRCSEQDVRKMLHNECGYRWMCNDDPGYNKYDHDSFWNKVWGQRY